MSSPAPGNRHTAIGTLYNVGDNGFNWSSTPNGSSAGRLYFNYGGLGSQNVTNRANGLPVRCLQE